MNQFCKTRRRLLLASCGLTLGRTALAQPRGKPPRIGVFWITSDADANNLDALRAGLRARGYVDGQNVVLVTRHNVSTYDRLPDGATQLVRDDVDVIVSYGGTATTAVAKATSAIPIVMITSSDPVTLGLANSLSKPGRNVTGLTFNNADIRGKRLEVLRELVPSLRRIGTVYDPASPTEVSGTKAFETAAAALGLEVRRLEIRSAIDIDPVLSRVTPGVLDALHVNTSSLFFANRDKLVAAIDRTRVPALFGSREYVKAGGLISVGAESLDGFRVASDYVDKILRGAKPAEMPIQQAAKVELVINALKAKALGLVLPQSLLVRADEVIQ